MGRWKPKRGVFVKCEHIPKDSICGTPVGVGALTRRTSRRRKETRHKNTPCKTRTLFSTHRTETTKCHENDNPASVNQGRQGTIFIHGIGRSIIKGTRWDENHSRCVQFFFFLKGRRVKNEHIDNGAKVPSPRRRKMEEKSPICLFTGFHGTVIFLHGSNLLSQILPCMMYSNLQLVYAHTVTVDYEYE